jgi:hypothetical protein
MKHIALIIFLSALCVLNFVFAFSPALSRRQFRFPKSDAARKVLHVAFAIVFLLGALLSFYAFLNPRGTQ